jgi:hypothetical protein
MINHFITMKIKIEVKDENLTIILMFVYRFSTAQKLDKLGMRGSDTYVCMFHVSFSIFNPFQTTFFY